MNHIRLEDRDLLAEIDAEFLGNAGPLLTGTTLAQALGFSDAEFSQALVDGNLPVPTFLVDGQEGLHANSWDVACWLISSGKNMGKASLRSNKGL